MLSTEKVDQVSKNKNNVVFFLENRQKKTIRKINR